jgi:hypothetical protein
MKYPVYVISKGRHDCCLTARFLLKDGVDFRIVVEPQERELYAAEFGDERLIVTPFSNLGLGSIPARNFVWEHSIEAGAKRHWILDDNIYGMRRRFKTKKLPCDSRLAMTIMEDFADRYENLAVAGPAYSFFVFSKLTPFYLNCHVYSTLLIQNDVPFRWRGRYNEDTDLCLQVLAGGWCTALFNALMIEKRTTMSMKGGNASELYKGDGRLKMARALERMWPGVVKVDRRFNRPQHVVKDSWRRFDTPLKRRADVDFSKFEKVNEFGMKLVQVKEIKSPTMRKIFNERNS